MEEAGAVNRKILEFCKENGVSGNRANLAAVCAEEMTVNIIKFGGKTSNWIDINLSLEDSHFRISRHFHSIIIAESLFVRVKR